MHLKFSKNLDKLDIYANGRELAMILAQDMVRGKRVYSYDETVTKFVATIKKPVLITDTYEVNKFSPTVRDTVYALYSQAIRITEYDGLVFRFEQRKYPSVWGPSIDTLLFAKNLKKINFKNIKTVLEIGTGSGFLSKYILEKNKNVKEVHIIDINKEAIQCAKDHIQDKRARFYCGNGLKYLKNKKFDLVLCNPPYIPRPRSIDDNPYEGISLLVDLLLNAKEYLNAGGILMTNISSLGERIISQILDTKGIKVTYLEKMKVPLKVFNVINNKKWIHYLRKKKGLVAGKHPGYEFWHTINIVSVKS
jgi:release factor glutamine methyltransferase